MTTIVPSERWIGYGLTTPYATPGASTKISCTSREAVGLAGGVEARLG